MVLYPAAADTCAMPAPISPQPRTPTVLICMSLITHPEFQIPESPNSDPKLPNQAVSTIAAIPWPPPMQAVARPRFNPRRRNSSVSVSSSRVPVMPSG